MLFVLLTCRPNTKSDLSVNKLLMGDYPKPTFPKFSTLDSTVLLIRTMEQSAYGSQILKLKNLAMFWYLLN